MRLAQAGVWMAQKVQMVTIFTSTVALNPQNTDR